MRQAAKRCLNAVAMVVVSPLALWYYVGGRVIGDQQMFQSLSQLLSLVPGLTGQYLRRAFFRYALPSCGPDSCVGFGSLFSHPTASIGARAYVGSHCMLGDVDVGDDVLIGSNVSIINGNRQHGIDRLDLPVREQPGEFPKVVIGVDSWIGDRAIVMASVGRHSVVGAGSVVTKPVPDYAIVVGNPARVVGERSQPSDEQPSDEPDGE